MVKKIILKHVDYKVNTVAIKSKQERMVLQLQSALPIKKEGKSNPETEQRTNVRNKIKICQPQIEL